jgi:hypothetical protein
MGSTSGNIRCLAWKQIILKRKEVIDKKNTILMVRDENGCALALN